MASEFVWPSQYSELSVAELDKAPTDGPDATETSYLKRAKIEQELASSDSVYNQNSRIKDLHTIDKKIDAVQTIMPQIKTRSKTQPVELRTKEEARLIEEMAAKRILIAQVATGILFVIMITYAVFGWSSNVHVVAFLIACVGISIVISLAYK